MDVTKKKFVMANIKIPIEIKENNVCEPYMDLLDMEITELQSLPVIDIDPEIQKQLKHNLFIFSSKIFPERNEVIKAEDSQNPQNPQNPQNSQNPQNPQNPQTHNTTQDNMSLKLQLVVKKDELKKKSQPINMSFKTYNKKSCKKYTIKNYDNNGR